MRSSMMLGTTQCEHKRGNSYDAANELFTVVHDATKRGGTAESGSAWHANEF